MTELRQHMIEDMRLRGLAERIQQVYVEAVEHLAARYGRSPDQLTEDEVRDFILHHGGWRRDYCFRGLLTAGAPFRDAGGFKGVAR